MALKLISPVFREGGTIPSKYTCQGQDISPPLTWSDIPSGCKSFALIVEDPDASSGTMVHWVLYNIPSEACGLREGILPHAELADKSRHGKNGIGELGYVGPCPPIGSTHRYVFKLYALYEVLELPSGATKERLLRAMKGHILAETELVGRYCAKAGADAL